MVALAAVVMLLPALVPSWDAGVDVDGGVTVVLISLAMFGFFGLVRANGELSAARVEVARLAAEGERNRIARDLHDLLGHSLTTITIKAGLARRLAPRDPDRAAIEIGEVEELARRSLREVRAAVSGYRDVTLRGELATSQEVLRAAGIATSFPGSIDHVHADCQSLFAWVVREGVTNVVRHARATTCTVSMGRDWIEVVDDGAAAAASAPAPPGSGLAGLGERVAAARGHRDLRPVPAGLAVACGRPDAVVTLRLLVADDQALIRSALAALLSLEPDFEVVAEVGRGDEVVAAVIDHSPDVALLDIEMPGIDGLTAAAELTATQPSCRVIILTTFGRPGYLRRAMEAGALGFVVKDAPVEQLADAVRRVSAGERVVDPALAAATLAGGPSPLTPRERDVLVVARDGATVADIASCVHLSEGTVRNYLSSAIAKTGARNRVEAGHLADQRGWL